ISWDNVTAEMPDPGTLVITADLVTEDVISSGDYKGDEVNEEFVRSYVTGADAYWLAPGVLVAREVTFACSLRAGAAAATEPPPLLAHRAITMLRWLSGGHPAPGEEGHRYGISGQRR